MHWLKTCGIVSKTEILMSGKWLLVVSPNYKKRRQLLYYEGLGYAVRSSGPLPQVTNDIRGESRTGRGER
jgi:hypothetical protein